MLDALHARLHRSSFFQRFTAFIRLLLAVGFIPPGLKKVMGLPFTVLPTTNPVGYFFDAFFQAQAFYIFVGIAQVAAGVLLLLPRTATLGAVFYFPIILTIAVITIAIGFQGTGPLTVLMTIACLYLLVWDYDRLKGLLPVSLVGSSRFERREYRMQVGVWAVAGMAAYGVAALIGLANLWANFGAVGFLVAAMTGSLFGVAMAWHLRRMPGAGSAHDKPDAGTLEGASTTPAV